MKINQTGENKGFAFLTFDSTEGWGYILFISKLFLKNFKRNYTHFGRFVSVESR